MLGQTRYNQQYGTLQYGPFSMTDSSEQNDLPAMPINGNDINI